MSKKITGAEYPISKIFSSDFDYVIPAYQRPYAWTTDQVSELFDDLYDFYVREQEENYFLGSIVLIKEEGNPLSEVIDGQQRLTSLTILLAVITSCFKDDLKSDFENYIREPGRPSQGLQPKPRLALRERDRKFFSDYIQDLQLEKLFALNSAQLDNESQRNILTNAKLLADRVQKKFNANVPSICSFGSFIVQRCFLVAVSTPNQQSAFRIFSVLNSRGLDLLPTDIIKSNVIGSIKAEHQEQFTEKWEEIEVQTGRYGFAELFGHIRMIFAKNKAKRALLDEFKEYVISAVPDPEKLMSDVIDPYAEAYMIAKKSQYTSTANAKEINNLLHWLNRIDNSDWLPSAILFLSQKKAEPEYVLWFFQKLERLAAYLHICSKNINDRIDRYSSVITALQANHSLASPIHEIELTQTEKDELISVISGKVYWMTARKRSYLILRLDSFIADTAATYDPAVLTIEHVLPQTVDTDSEWNENWPDPEKREEWIHRLANLVPLTQSRNSKAQNYDFDKKKTAYFTGKNGVSSYVLTTQVLNTQTWDEDTLKQRQLDLLDIIKGKWDL